MAGPPLVPLLVAWMPGGKDDARLEGITPVHFGSFLSIDSPIMFGENRSNNGYIVLGTSCDKLGRDNL